MPSPATRPLFDEAARLGIGFCLGYAELTEPDATGTRHRYNSQVLVERDGTIVATYRKVHLPGHEKDEPIVRSSTPSATISNPGRMSSAFGTPSAGESG